MKATCFKSETTVSNDFPPFVCYCLLWNILSFHFHSCLFRNIPFIIIQITCQSTFLPSPAMVLDDIVKQKLPSNNGGFKAIGFGKTNECMYSELTTDHPIDLCRYQVANGYMGRVGLINSGGESHGESDLHDAVVTAVVNKRAGGMGLISGRKAFQKPMKDGVQLLNTIQDVYLDSSITIA